jgi:hypothetical protein
VKETKALISYEASAHKQERAYTGTITSFSIYCP